MTDFAPSGFRGDTTSKAQIEGYFYLHDEKAPARESRAGAFGRFRLSYSAGVSLGIFRAR